MAHNRFPWCTSIPRRTAPRRPARPESPNSRVYFFEAPFQREPVQIGRERLSDRASRDQHRLLVFENPLSDTTADRVFGHADFTPGGTTPLHGKVPPASASRLLRPTSLAFDTLGNLYVADTEYNRVLAFDRP